MGLYNDEYTAICALKLAVRNMVNDYLTRDKSFVRLQSYIQLANNNIDKVESQIKANNLYYEDCTFVKFSFNKACLIVQGKYELTLHYKQWGEDKFVGVGIDSFLLTLIECGLLSD